MKPPFRPNIALLALYLGACSQEKPITTQRAETTLSDSTAAASATVPIQHAAPAAEAVARNMIRWYAQNMETLPADLVLNADGADTTKSYAVNFPGTEAWLKALKATGYFSPTYLSSWRTYFRQQDDSLRLHPQNDGVPAGFAYDFILYSQEADSKIQELQAGTFSSILKSPTHAVVLAAGPRHVNDDSVWQEKLLFELSNTGSRGWLVDAISNPTDEDLQQHKLDLPK